MGQSQSKSQDRRGSGSSTAPLNQENSLEKAYATFYGSETYASVSAASAASPHHGSNLSQPTSNFHPPISAYNTAVRPDLAQVSQGFDTGITQPAPPPNLYRVSELIDPHDLLSRSGSDYSFYNSKPKAAPAAPRFGYSAAPNVYKELPPLVESPSGNLLGAQEFLDHPNRPLAIRERQEHIRVAIQQVEMEARMKREAEEMEESSRKMSKGSKSSKSRKGSASTCNSGHQRNMSDFSLHRSGRNDSIKSFEDQKIEEGRLAYEATMERKQSGSVGCFSCFR